jgi:transposase
MVPDLIAEIQRYAEAVDGRQVQPTVNRCPHCRGEPECFLRHDRRRRVFLVVLGRVVHKVLSALTRWKCPLCTHRFTLYPPFALPRKRYVKESIFELARAHLEEDELSYRRAVAVERMPVFYAERDDESIDERSLSHSTLHRWHSLFFSLLETLREAQHLVRQKSARSDLFRRVFAPAPTKYRSEERRTTLARALRALWTEQEYRSLFGRSIFPELATACSWR